MLIRGVIQHEIQNDAHIPRVRFAQKRFEILKRAILWGDICVVRDVVPAVPVGGGEMRREPDRIYTEIGKIIKFFCDAYKITNAIPIAISKRARVDLIEDCSLPPF